jgi:molybdopterin-guanine dinucleotide biosynthesis protein B
MKKIKYSLPIMGFAAFSGTGKTTLLVQLLPMLRQRGLRVGVVKHAHHEFDIDQPGKDSYELRKAGATQMLVASSRRSALVIECEQHVEPRLADQLSMLDSDALDLVLVEGFKTESFPKIELHRAGLDRPLLCNRDDSIIAVASDEPLTSVTHIPVINLNQPDEIANFILAYIAVPQSEARAAP